MSTCANKLQTIMLNLLHDTHPGMVRVKALTRSYGWWLGINKALEHTVQICHPSQQTRSEPGKTLLYPLEFPARPWQGVDVEFVSPFQGQIG